MHENNSSAVGLFANQVNRKPPLASIAVDE